MASDVSGGKCAVCKTATTKLCSGCHDAPAYGSSESNVHSTTLYCSVACRRSDWNAHKSECKNLQARKKLVRATRMLRGMMLAIRRHAYRHKFDRVGVEATQGGEGIKIILMETSGLPQEACWVLTPVPNIHKDLDAIMMHCACVEVDSYLGDWVDGILADTCSKIEQFKLERNRKARFQIFTEAAYGTVLPPDQHYVYRVTLRSSAETWAIDLTGSQFGYRDVLYRWGEIGKHGWSIRDDIPLVVFERASADIEELRLEINKDIPGLVKLYGGKAGTLCGLLEGSDSAFDNVEKAVLDQCEAAVKRGMARLMTPEEMKKKLSRMADPSRVADRRFWNKEQRRFWRS